MLRGFAGRRPRTPGGRARPDPRGHPDPATDPALEADRRRVESLHTRFGTRHERIGAHLTRLCADAGVTGGRVLEIGGRENPHREEFPGFEYLNLDLTETGPGVLLGDITNCPEIPSGSFDVIISVDVFEHVKEPWKAAAEITRLLRPGGFTYHSTLFSWRYHPCPADYWRYTPDALMFLFRDLELVRCDFDAVERRRNLLGKGRFRLTPDELGGWRENWRVFYAGVKPPRR